MSARLVEQAGFGAVYMTGFGASASLLGRPDVGLLSFGEMVDHARRLVRAVGVPVIADADDGYGNPLNVMRTVREYEAAGVAALHIEDQVAPKRCGHMSGKDVIPAEEMVEKVREAGADMLFVEAPETEDEVVAVAEAFPDTPLLFNAIDGGRTPPLEVDRLRALGFRLILCPLTALLAAASAVRDALHALRDGTPGADGRLPFSDFTDLVGLPDIQRLEERYTARPGR